MNLRIGTSALHPIRRKPSIVLRIIIFTLCLNTINNIANPQSLSIEDSKKKDQKDSKDSEKDSKDPNKKTDSSIEDESEVPIKQVLFLFLSGKRPNTKNKNSIAQAAQNTALNYIPLLDLAWMNEVSINQDFYSLSAIREALAVDDDGIKVSEYDRFFMVFTNKYDAIERINLSLGIKQNSRYVTPFPKFGISIGASLKIIKYTVYMENKLESSTPDPDNSAPALSFKEQTIADKKSIHDIINILLIPLFLRETIKINNTEYFFKKVFCPGFNLFLGFNCFIALTNNFRIGIITMIYHTGGVKISPLLVFTSRKSVSLEKVAENKKSLVTLLTAQNERAVEKAEMLNEKQDKSPMVG